MISKKVSLLTLSLALAGSVFVTVPMAHAQGTTTTNQHQGFFQGLLQFFEQKFGISHTDAQNAVQEYQTQRKATITPRKAMSAQEVEDREKVRLDKLVTDGKITSSQESAILAELAALRAKYPFDANQTPEQRKTNMTAMQTDLKAWATAQGIDLSLIQGGFGMMGGGMMDRGRMRGRHGFDLRPSGTPSVTPAQ